MIFISQPDILRKNKFDIGKIRSVGGCYGGKRAKQMERRIMKGFTLEIYDLLKDSLDKQDKNKSVDIFQVMAEAMHKSKNCQQSPSGGGKKKNPLPTMSKTFSGFSTNSDYSPATMVAANKFKRFLGKHLKSNGTEEKLQNNNLQNGTIRTSFSPFGSHKDLGTVERKVLQVYSKLDDRDGRGTQKSTLLITYG